MPFFKPDSSQIPAGSMGSSHIKGIGEAQRIELGLATHQATQVLRLGPERWSIWIWMGPRFSTEDVG
jgi:hypothetical protein